MKNILLGLLYTIPMGVFCQPGSAGSPFTALGNARTVSSAGIYYFNLMGTLFSSYVTSNGMVLVATDFGGAAASNLPSTTALSNTGRGILNPTVLSRLTSATVVSYTTSNGSINVTTTNTTVLNKITINETIHRGNIDAAANADWVGTGQANVRATTANCTTPDGVALNVNIHHPCGSFSGFHWQPAIGAHRIAYNSGESAGSVRFNLWVQAPLVALPITLSIFKAVALTDNTVQLDWTTSSEINSSHFEVERSADAVSWQSIINLSAHQNSSVLQAYSARDYAPIVGINFYRLKLIDIDGSTAYSNSLKIRAAFIQNRSIKVYPNPSNSLIYLQMQQPEPIKILDGQGNDITEKVRISSLTNNRYSLECSNLARGIYIIRGTSYSYKILLE